MSRNRKFDYNKAEADLEDAGACHPDEIFDYRSEKAFRGHLKEHGLNPDKYIKSDSSGSSNSGNSACYLTTACVVSRGLPDDCDELQTLRAFRDSYLAALPNGREEIDRYYQMAPGIVVSINKQENYKSIWEQVYTELIAPCVRMIKAKENDSAYKLYKSYSLKLFELYCG